MSDSLSLPSYWSSPTLAQCLLQNDSGTWGNLVSKGVGFPVLRSTNIQGGCLTFDDIAWCDVSPKTATKYELQNGDIIITKSSGSPQLVGKNALFVHPNDGNKYLFSNFTQRLRVDTAIILPEYLFYYLNSSYALAFLEQMQNTTSGLRNLSIKQYVTQNIPLPPLPEQRRIVAILRQADMLRQLREEANAKTLALKYSLFQEIVGNHRVNEKGWKICKVKDVGEVLLGRQRAPKYQSGQYTHPYLRVANVFEDRLDLSDVLSMDFDAGDFKRFKLEDGDILLNEGQSTELVGRPAMWHNEIPNCCFQNTLVRFRADQTKVEPEFALGLFLIYFKLGDFSKISSKTSNVAHLGASRFASMDFLLPPLEIQRKYVTQLKVFREIYAALFQSIQKFEELFSTLMTGAFNGELTASWREKHKEELQRAAVERDQKLGLRGEVATLKDAEEGRLTPEEEEQLRQALGQFAVNVNKLAEPMGQSMLESVRQMSMVYQDIIDPLLQNIRSNMQAAASVLLEKIQPISRENFLAYINNLPIPQEKRAIIETLDTATIQVLKLAGTYPAYFTADDLEAGELGGITTLQAEGSLRTLQALGFVKLVQIDGLLRYRLTDENDFADLPSSLSVQS